MFSAGQASAASVEIFVDDGTLTDWESITSVTVGDKEFTYISQTGLDENVISEFQEIIPGGLYNFSLHDLEQGPVGDWVLEFSLAILSPFDLSLDISGSDIDTTSILNNTSVTADIYSDAGFTNLLASISTVNGVPSPNVVFAGGDQIWVRMTGDVDSTGILSDVVLQFDQVETGQAPIPEPSTLILACFGGVGVIAMSRLRRRKAIRN